MRSTTVILISSDPLLIEAVRDVVEPVNGLRLEVMAGVDRACERTAQGDVALVLFHQGPRDGVAAVTWMLQTLAPRGSVSTLILSDDNHPEEALALLRLGAADYLARPLDLGRLSYMVDVLTLSARSLPASAPAPADQPIGLLDGDHSFVYMQESEMGRLIAQVRRIAPQDTTILLEGETGTGKTRLAGLIHRFSRRGDKPMLSINCGALSASLIESEMFGHVKGAFTGADSDRVGKFAAVGRGTLFFDEVDSLPMALQAKLLRAVEERVFEPVGSNKTQPMQARLIVASNRPLEQEVAAGRFRADLFYRLNVVAFTLPPLRDRMTGVPHLVRSFLEEFSAHAGRPIHRVTPEAMRALLDHRWPGNIRELRNVIERALHLCHGDALSLDDLPQAFHGPAAAATHGLGRGTAPDPAPAPLMELLDRAERERILQALAHQGNNRIRAAAELGISRMTLYKKLHKYGLMAPS